ncbi:Pectin lyase fold [Phytophthora cactorum]|nr:Pectin lyase fold [Phytophthora cactorum]
MSDDGRHKRWFPLESNPEVMNSYVDKMGFPTSQFSFCDVLSTEEWALAMVPTPVVGVIMLFPIKAHTEEADKQEAARIEKDGQTVSPNVYYMRQTVGNACGTVGILHAIGNMRHLVQLTPGSYLDKFFNKTKTKSPEEIAQYLEEDDEVGSQRFDIVFIGKPDFVTMQLESVDDPINTHFVCFSCVDGNLYELDGRKKRPINHGPSSPDTVLQDACQVIKKFMARDEGEVRFTILALAKTATSEQTPLQTKSADPSFVLFSLAMGKSVTIAADACCCCSLKQQQQLQSTYAYRVQQEVRIQNKLEVNKQIPINVYLRAGRYELSDTFDFTDDDSGAADEAPVTYQAYCDAAVENAAISTRSFPYRSGSGIPRDYFGMEWATSTTSAQDVGSDIGTVCVDKNNGVGHTCYAQDSPMATCVSGCMTACQSHIARKRYSEKFYNKFTHLFGKDLRKEEDCVEICSLSCRGCEKVVISGSKLIPAATLTWTLDQSVTVTSAKGGPQVLKIFRTDLSSILPGLPAGIVPAKPEAFATFSTLYVDDVQLPRAGFPNCLVDSALPAQTLDCSYALVDVVASQVLYNATTFSSRVSTWTNVKEIIAELRPQSAQPTSLHYSLSAFDTMTATLQLGAGGSELSYDIFTDGPGASWSSPASLDPVIRVENVFQELDSPGEWFFDVSTRQLYLIPLKASTTATSLAKSVLEIPLLHQLLRVSGTRENQYVTPTHAHTTLKETTSLTKASNIRFRYITFSGTQLHHLNIYERIPGSAWPMTRVASIFLESVTNTTIEYCSFEKIGGNAILVSGENSNIQITNNNVSFVGSNGISVVARRGFQLNSFHEPVLSHLLVPRAVNISFNQVHHFGQQVAHSAAIMVVGAKETTIHGNLVFDAPTSTDSTPVLSSQFQVTVPLLDFDVNIVAKLVGAPECFSGSGRIGSREPGETIDLAATSSAYFNSIIDVYLGFHVVTPNQIFNLPTQAKWQILTRSCNYAEQTYQETCGGPCVQLDGCGNSNVAYNKLLELRWPAPLAMNPIRNRWYVQVRSRLSKTATAQE